MIGEQDDAVELVALDAPDEVGLPLRMVGEDAQQHEGIEDNRVPARLDVDRRILGEEARVAREDAATSGSAAAGRRPSALRAACLTSPCMSRRYEPASDQSTTTGTRHRIGAPVEPRPNSTQRWPTRRTASTPRSSRWFETAPMSVINTRVTSAAATKAKCSIPSRLCPPGKREVDQRERKDEPDRRRVGLEQRERLRRQRRRRVRPAR